MAKYLDDTGAEKLNELLATKFGTKLDCTVLTSTVRPWSLDEGVYKLPANCILYPYGTGTTGALSLTSTSIMYVTAKKNDYNEWFILYGNTTARYLVAGYSTADSGGKTSLSLGNVLTSISGYVKNNLTYSTSSTTYALSAYQGYVLNQNKEEKSNKVTSISSSSTDDQYPSAKLLYDQLALKGTYSKPSGGIPDTDLSSSVQTSLGLADTALQSYTEQYTGTITGITMNGTSKGTSGVVDLGTVITSHQDISGKENTNNKVTSISSSSTDTQYPSAKAVFDNLSITDVGSINLVDGTLPTELMIANERYYRIKGKFYLNNVEDRALENAIVYVYWGGSQDCVINAIAGAGMVLYGTETTITKQFTHSNGSWSVTSNKTINAGTTDLTAGTSALPTGSIYFVYE